MWVIDGQATYQAQGYAKPPVLTAFAPGFVQLQAKLTPTLSLRAEYWIMESHAIGGRFTLGSVDRNPVTIRLDLFGHVASEGIELPLGAVPVAEGAALLFGQVGNLRPAVLLEGGQAQTQSGKVGVSMTVPPGGKMSARWVHAGLSEADASLALARRWLREDWAAAFRTIEAAAQALPVIETGDAALDATFATSVVQLIQAFVQPSTQLPGTGFISARDAERPYHPRATGADYAPTDAYLAALGAASIHPTFAEGMVRNYLATQQADGWIDWMPVPASPRYRMLCLPVLARLAWSIFQYTENETFLRESFVPLLRFFQRWQQPDLDTDGDGLPEWRDETQTGCTFLPMFSVGATWGQHADIRTVEAPDLAAYLLSEASSLREMAYFLRDETHEKTLSDEIERLKGLLESLWHDGRYAYRDRDTHQTTTSVPVLDAGNGDETHFPALELAPANRLIVHISGGVEHVPRIRLVLEGADGEGKPLVETAETPAFLWANGRGVYTSQQVFSRIDRIFAEGLVRVYRIGVRTMDTTLLDITALLPLWSAGIPTEHATATLDLLTQSFLRPNGLAMSGKGAPSLTTANPDGGVWLYWLTLVGEGLIETGYGDLAAEILKRVLRAQVAALREQKHFSEFYHSAEPRGMGTRGHASGIVPLHLFLRVLGARVVSPGKVWTGGDFHFDTPVTLTQHGVTIRRSAEGTQVHFPSGHRVDLPADAAWGAVIDPHWQPPAPPQTPDFIADDPFGDAS